jgi:uncharacterized protein (DUF1778 family)
MIYMRTHRIKLRMTEDERQLDGAVAAAAQQIVLNDDEATRFVDALDGVNENTVARLRDLRQRA